MFKYFTVALLGAVALAGTCEEDLTEICDAHRWMESHSERVVDICQEVDSAEKGAEGFCFDFGQITAIASSRHEAGATDLFDDDIAEAQANADDLLEVAALT